MSVNDKLMDAAMCGNKYAEQLVRNLLGKVKIVDLSDEEAVEISAIVREKPKQ